MARALSPEVAEALKSGRAGLSSLALFVFPEGTYGLFTGSGGLEWNGHLYKGVGNFLKVPKISSSTGNEALGAVITLSDIPVSHLDDDFVYQIENFSYDNAPCLITIVAVDIETDEFLGPVMSELYEIDVPTHEIGAVDENGQATCTISATLETAKREISAATHVRTSSAEHQRDFGVNDNSAQHLSSVGKFQLKLGSR